MQIRVFDQNAGYYRLCDLQAPVRFERKRRSAVRRDHVLFAAAAAADDDILMSRHRCSGR